MKTWKEDKAACGAGQITTRIPAPPASQWSDFTEAAASEPFCSGSPVIYTDFSLFFNSTYAWKAVFEADQLHQCLCLLFFPPEKI